MAKQLEYSVQRRIEVWVEATIRAVDFEGAVAHAKTMKLDDFVEIADGATMIDYDFVRGLAVTEQ